MSTNYNGQGQGPTTNNFTGFPKSGDRAPGPGDVLVRPSATRMPFSRGMSKGVRPGALLPNGPEFPTPFPTANVKALPQWAVRVRQDPWMTSAQRQIVLNALASLFRAQTWPIAWQVDERHNDDRSSTIFSLLPFMILTITRRVDRTKLQGSIQFRDSDRATSEAFTAQVATLINSLEAQQGS